MKIFFVTGMRAGEELDFAVPTITVGREPDNLIELPTSGVSRYHGRLWRDENGDWYAEDLGSTNGVKVNTRKIEEACKLREGDLVEFGDQLVRVSELREVAPKVVFQPVATVSAAPRRHSAADTVKVVPLTPLTVPTVTELPPVPPRAVPENNISEAIREGKVKLFGGHKSGGAKVQTGGGAETHEGGKNKRLISNRLFYTIVIACVAIALSVFYQIMQQSGAAAKPSVKPRSNIRNFLLYYEKEIVSSKNIFRFSLRVENGAATVVIDDLQSGRRFLRDFAALSESSVELLRNRVERANFFRCAAPQPGASADNERDVRRLVVADNGKLNDVAVVNTAPPKEFEELEFAINDFADGYGLQTIAMTPEELQEQAVGNFNKAEDLFENREAKLSNLRAAILRYAVAVDYLEQFSPKPQLWTVARKKLDAAVKLRDQKLAELNYERIRLVKFKQFDALRSVFRQIMELSDPDSAEYDTARQRLFTLDNFLNQAGKRK